MSKTPEEQYAELKNEEIERQWIENYKRNRRRILKAEAELADE